LLELGVKILLAYLLGSIVGSLLVGRLRGGIDIREVGSGNAGGTNALRTQGIWFAFWVVVIDVGKGVLASAVIPHIDLPGMVTQQVGDAGWLTVACASAAVIGHVFPVWYGFRGGKGAATLLGALAGIDALLLIPVIATWLVVVVLTGFVGLATMLATASLPVYLAVAVRPVPVSLLAFACAMTLFVAYTHRANLQRMRDGTENRARRLWLLRPR
jgi:acyl phosphate:glycerol-3-phosphate acyltransferase